MKILVIGASKGGFRALPKLLAGLGAGFPLPIAVVAHRTAQGSDPLEEHLARTSPLPVRSAEDKMPILAGVVVVAPADYHLLIDGGHYALSTEPPVAYSRPSIDLLFESAARAFGRGVIAVVLTGANEDGARGAAEVKAAGGVVLVEDPTTAEVARMPAAAIRRAAVDRVRPIDEMAAAVLEVVREGK
jgi:two-component system chemotaxis response regulator CheB